MSEQAASEFSGHATLADGSHVHLTADDCKALWEASELHREARAAAMPDDARALRVMCEAHERLRELGWREAMYCPKDGSAFEVIEAGSSGIHRCHYQGEWPTGSYWIEADHDLWPSKPILFRLYPEDEARRKAKMAEAAARFRAEHAVRDPSITPQTVLPGEQK